MQPKDNYNNPADFCQDGTKVEQQASKCSRRNAKCDKNKTEANNESQSVGKCYEAVIVC
jgi:hypothetical protein